MGGGISATMGFITAKYRHRLEKALSRLGGGKAETIGGILRLFAGRNFCELEKLGLVG